MTIDEIMDLWMQDVEIDKTELGDESIKIAKLHQKYYTILSKERMALRKYESDMKALKLDKYEFLTQGPNEDTRDKGWRLPPKGMVLKSDLPMYMDADADIRELNLKIAYQQEKIDYLTDVIRMLHNRSYQIRNGIEWQKFTMGG